LILVEGNFPQIYLLGGFGGFGVPGGCKSILNDFMEFQRNRISINPVDAITELMQVHLRN